MRAAPSVICMVRAVGVNSGCERCFSSVICVVRALHGARLLASAPLRGGVNSGGEQCFSTVLGTSPCKRALARWCTALATDHVRPAHHLHPYPCAPVDILPHAVSKGGLQLGDVLTEVDGSAISGKEIDWTAETTARKRVIKLIRQKGFISLVEGVVVRPTRCVLQRVNREAVAFEIALDQIATDGGQSSPKKVRYVFICHSTDEADQWQAAIREQCPTSAAALLRAQTTSSRLGSSRFDGHDALRTLGM